MLRLRKERKEKACTRESERERERRSEREGRQNRDPGRERTNVCRLVLRAGALLDAEKRRRKRKKREREGAGRSAYTPGVCGIPGVSEAPAMLRKEIKETKSVVLFCIALLGLFAREKQTAPCD